MPQVLIVLIFILTVLAGCGGGSGGSEGGTPAATPSAAPSAPRPKNIILFIGDGMGFESVRATSLFQTGSEEGLNFQSFPHQGKVAHNSAGGSLTDSAAAGTAMATGRKVNNGVISLALPGDGSELTTLLEIAKAQGKSVGLVTNSFIEDATPAAFAAHETTRSARAAIAEDYLQRSRPDLLMGGYTAGALEPTAAANAGYNVVTDRDSLVAATPGGQLAGLFGIGLLPYEFDGDFTTVPKLSEMTEVALSHLDQAEAGFFLMVESETIDESGHLNHIERHVAAGVEFALAVQKGLDWAADRQDTLIVITADHETGGLTVISSRGIGQIPETAWSTRGHTMTEVPVYARGPLSDNFVGDLENTDIFSLLKIGLDGNSGS